MKQLVICIFLRPSFTPNSTGMLYSKSSGNLWRWKTLYIELLTMKSSLLFDLDPIKEGLRFHLTFHLWRLHYGPPIVVKSPDAWRKKGFGKESASFLISFCVLNSLVLLNWYQKSNLMCESLSTRKMDWELPGKGGKLLTVSDYAFNEVRLPVWSCTVLYLKC